MIIQQDYHRTSYKNHFDLFQKGVYYQHLKYLFKFLQNTILNNQTNFMKNWDIISQDIVYLNHNWA